MAATEQERIQILVELLGIDELEQRAQKGAQAFNTLNEAIKGSSVGGGGQPQALRLAETAAGLQLRQAQMQARAAETILQRYLKTDEGKAAQRILDFPIRTTKAGEPNKNDEKSAAAQYRKNKEIVDELVTYREAVLKTAKAEASANSAITSIAEKRQRAEYEAAGYAADDAALVKFRAERQRGLLRSTAQVEAERLRAERETAQAAKSLATQTRAGQARQAAQEAFLRENKLPLDQLQGYTRPLAEGTHEPARTAVALARAQSEETDVRRRITQIIDRNQAGELRANETLQQLSSAQRQLTAVVQRRTAVQERLDAESSGFAGQFRRGFKGASDRPYAEQLGQAVKFSAFYGAAYRIQFALLQTFRDALVEGIEFEQGLSDLSIATGQTKEQLTGVANQLAKTASDAGVSPSAGLAIGARSIGLYGLAGSKDRDQQDYVATLSAQVVSKLTLGGKADPVTVQQNLAAITQALGIGATGQLRIADLDAYFSKRFGTAPGDTLEAGAQSASVGIAAGFSLEQIQAAAALMISRTGQSSSAVGGYLAQIFSRGGEGSLTGVANKYGIETQGRELADVFADLAKKYQQSGSAAQAEISAAFGRGKVQNAVVSLLQSFQEVQDEAKKARGGAADGALNRSFGERINNIGGQIAVLGGHFKEFARLFGQSGLLAVLGIGVELLDQFLTSVNAVLRVFNELPEAVRVFLGLLLTARLARGAGIGGDLLGGLAGRAGTGVAATGIRGIGQLGVNALKAAGPIALFTTAVIGAGKTLEHIANIREQIKAGTQALRQSPGYGATPVELNTYASLLRDQARNLNESNNGITGHIADALTAGDPDAMAKALRKQAAEAEKLAEEVAKATRPDQPGIIPDLSQEGIAAGLERVTATGGDAADRLRALRQAIHGVGEEAEAASTKIDPKQLGLEFARIKAPKEINFRVPGMDAPGYENALKNRNPAALYLDQLGTLKGSTIAPDVNAQLPSDKLTELVMASLKAQGITDFANLTPEAANKAADAAVAEIETGGRINRQNLSAVRDAYSKIIAKALLNAGKNVTDVINGAESLTNEQAVTAMTALAQETSGRLGQKSNVDYAGRMRVLRNSLRTARYAQSIADTADLPAITNQIADFQQQYVGVQVERLEALRHAAVASATSQRQATSLGRSFVRREIRAIVNNGGSADQLAAVLATAGKGAIAVARNTIQQALDVAKAAEQVRQTLIQAGAALSAALPGMFGTVGAALSVAGTLQPKQSPEIKRLQGLLDATNYVTPDANPDQIPGAKEKEEQETAAERRAARLAAEAARKGGDIAAARAAIAQARAELQKAKPGTVEYFNALASFYQAKDQLTEAFRNYRHILGELRIDQTDPVAEAQLALTEARRKLRQDRGKSGDVRAQDRLDVRNAQTQLESEKFNQRLSDVQTAEQLGRISHSAYMRYLESEHNRLSAIGKRTRQQQDELNQIDQLMKDAAGEMQGAFNIGDIKLPTPYEVRRYIKTQVTSTPYALGAGATSGSTTIYINGADTGAVKRIIDDTVGKGTRVLTTSTRRT